MSGVEEFFQALENLSPLTTLGKSNVKPARISNELLELYIWSVGIPACHLLKERFIGTRTATF